MIRGGLLLVFVFSFPETLFSRRDFNQLGDRTYWQKLAFRGKVLHRKITLQTSTHNFQMLRYWAVVVPCVYYMTTNTYGSILFVLTASSINKRLYHFNTAQNGLLLGVPLKLGCIIGECFTDWISDRLINHYAARHGEYRNPEVRLQLAWLGLFTPIGLIIHGISVAREAPWIALAVGMAVASVRVQAGTTLTYAYCNHCYKPQAPEVSTIINPFRQVFAFSIGFYALPFGEGHGFDVAWGTFAAINFAAWSPLLVLLWKGEQIRQSQGTPKLHEDL